MTRFPPSLACALALFALTPLSADTAGQPPAPAAAQAEPEIAVEFTFRPGKKEAAAIREVTVAGDFNDWNAFATPLSRGSDGTFRVRLGLRPGSHQWRFVINGAWVQDMAALAAQCTPKPDSFATHPSGGRNAVKTVR